MPSKCYELKNSNLMKCWVLVSGHSNDKIIENIFLVLNRTLPISKFINQQIIVISLVWIQIILD